MEEVKVVRDIAELSQIRPTGEVVFDWEANGLSVTKNRPVGLAVAYREGEGWTGFYVPVGHSDESAEGPQIGQNQLSSWCNEVMLSAEVCIAHNWAYDLGLFKKIGVDVHRLRIRDTMVIAWMLNTDSKMYGLKDLVKKLLGHKMQTFDSVVGNNLPSNVAVSKLSPYAVDDVIQTGRLYDLLMPDIRKYEMEYVLDALEMPFIPVLLHMEESGVRLDFDHLRTMDAECGAMVKEIQGKINASAGFPVNLRSGPQLWRAVQKWGWKIKPSHPKGKSGIPSMEKDWLAEYANDYQEAAWISESKKLQHRMSNLTLPLIDRAKQYPDHRLRPKFWHTGTGTGRLSSSDPNGQNIPVPNVAKPSQCTRRAFIAAEGWKMIVVDYSQIELRLMAHFSQDELMMKIYREDGDIHQLTADQCKCTRQYAKTINFGLIYGMGPDSLAYSLGIGGKEAKEYHSAYFKTYVGVDQFIKYTHRSVQDKLYVRTLAGRYRFLPDAAAAGMKVKSHALRQAVNTRIQGSAADLIKGAMRNMLRRFDSENALGTQARMMLQVHDEIVCEAREDYVEQACAIIQDSMENVVKLRVPLVAKPKVVTNWAEGK